MIYIGKYGFTIRSRPQKIVRNHCPSQIGNTLSARILQKERIQKNSLAKNENKRQSQLILSFLTSFDESMLGSSGVASKKPQICT